MSAFTACFTSGITPLTPAPSGASISQGIAHRLEQLILDGRYAPGQKIPSERQLSERLGVSRSIIREGLKELHGRRLIETRHGQGSFVSGLLTDAERDAPLMQLFHNHARTLYDLYEVREQLEGQAAALAAERGNPRDFHRITQAFVALEQGNTADAADNAQLDHAFHHAITEASHNPVLVHVLNSLKSLMLQSVQTSVLNLGAHAPQRQQIDRHHRQIYKAIIRRQAKWAQKVAMAHVRHVSDSLRALEEQEQGIQR